jgi:hypothetical protein
MRLNASLLLSALVCFFDVLMESEAMKLFKTLLIFGIAILLESIGISVNAFEPHWEMDSGQGYTLCERMFKIYKDDDKFRKSSEKGCVDLVLPQRMGFQEPPWNEEITDVSKIKTLLYQMFLYIEFRFTNNYFQTINNENNKTFINNKSVEKVKKEAKETEENFLNGTRIKLWRMPFPKELIQYTKTEEERKPLNVVGFFYYYNKTEFEKEKQRCSRYRLQKDQNFVTYLFNDTLTALDGRLNRSKNPALARALERLNNRGLFFYRGKLYMLGRNQISSLDINPGGHIFDVPFCTMHYQSLNIK